MLINSKPTLPFTARVHRRNRVETLLPDEPVTTALENAKSGYPVF